MYSRGRNETPKIEKRQSKQKESKLEGDAEPRTNGLYQREHRHIFQDYPVAPQKLYKIPKRGQKQKKRIKRCHISWRVKLDQ